jgi:cysteine desulfurase
VGWGAACAELADTATSERAAATNDTDRLRSGLAGLEGVELFGPGNPDHRLPHLVCFGLTDIEPQAVLLLLDQRGIAAHSGSSCASESLEPSPVLEAMGVAADRSLRLSVGWHTTDDDVTAAIAGVTDALAQLRQLR